MKALRTLFLLALAGIFMVMQSFGQGISYQAVARNADATPIASELINVRFYIVSGSASGTEVYRETHTVTTSPEGLFSLVVGKGSVEVGDFITIDWGAANHFLRVELNGVNMGEIQLETVPYSKVATAMRIDHLTDVSVGSVAVGEVLKWSGSQWTNQPDEVNDADADAGNEIQNLGLIGNQLSLTPGGGTVALPEPETIWTQNGNNIYYNDGNVGIGVNSPIDVLEVASSTAGGVLMSLEKSNAVVGNDVLEIRTQAGGPDGAAFIEMQRGATVEARVRTDGAAEFLNVTVEEDLAAADSPVKGRVYANALPVAYGYVSSGSTTASLVTDYGVSSITKPASTTGEYRITLNRTLAGECVIIGTSYNSSPNDETVTANRTSPTEVEINIVDGTGTPVNSNFYFVIYGTTL